MVPLIAGLLTTLAQNGLGMLASAIQAKGKEVIEEKIGVKIPDDPAKLTPELMQQLQIRQMENEEFLVAAGIEKQRLEIEENRLDVENTKSAREMQTAALQQGDLFSKRFVYYLATAWTLFAIVYISAITFAPIPAANQRFADTILGFLLGTIVATILNFFFGSSQGSVKAQQFFRDVAEKLKK